MLYQIKLYTFVTKMLNSIEILTSLNKKQYSIHFDINKLTKLLKKYKYIEEQIQLHTMY